MNNQRNPNQLLRTLVNYMNAIMICWPAIKKPRRNKCGFSAYGLWACNELLEAACLVSGSSRFLTEGKVFLCFTQSNGGLRSLWHNYISRLGFEPSLPPLIPHPFIHPSIHPPPALCSSFKMKALHSASGESERLTQCFPGILRSSL